MILGTWTLEAFWRIYGQSRACLCSLSGALHLSFNKLAESVFAVFALWMHTSRFKYTWTCLAVHRAVHFTLDIRKCTKCIEMPYSMESLSLFAMWQGRSKADLKLILESSRALTRALHKLGGHGVVAVVPHCELPQPH